jgi:hypothetical protein
MEQSGGGNTGLLLAVMEPPAALEAEFQDWYDTEHFVERARIKGFLSANRLICVDGWPKYLTLYDLTNISVMRGEGYAKIAGDNYSHWTQRIVPRLWGHYRAECRQVYPGNRIFGANGLSSRTALWRFRNVPASEEMTVVDGLRQLYESENETSQVRVFASEQTEGTDYIALIELYAPFVPTAGAIGILGAARKRLDMINHYTRYNRK